MAAGLQGLSVLIGVFLMFMGLRKTAWLERIGRSRGRRQRAAVSRGLARPVSFDLQRRKPANAWSSKLARGVVGIPASSGTPRSLLRGWYASQKVRGR